MAKRIVDEEMKFDIIVNGDNAKKELYDLEKSTRKLTEENKALGLQKKLLEKQNQKDTEAYKFLTKTIRENNAEIKANKLRMGELQNQIGITGMTMGQLTNKASQLKLMLRNLVPGSADYQRYSAELKQVTNRINELSGKAQQAKFSLSSIADGFNKYAALGATIVAAITGVVLSVQKIIDYNGKLADSITNVQKTTGMTKKEVDDLAKSFGMLKTRTGRIELLGIAEVGGRLGIAKEEIADFVKVMDKSAVALGDSFEGGPEVVAEKLGRIKGLYEDLRKSGVEEAFESVGSALNDLGAAGTASEQNVAEFATRVGAVPEAFRPPIQTVLGMGAAFEESGLRAEVAGNNYAKVISIASRDMAAFATVLKRPQAELERLINTDPNEFFLQFAGALKNLDATQLAKVLDYLKLNDNEVKMVLGAASANVDLFRDKIALATDSMAEATSLTQEYNLKNNNLAATLERIKKTVTGWVSSDGFVSFLASSAEWIAKVIGATDDADGSGQKWRNTLAFIAKAIAIVTAALVTSTTWMKLTALWTARNTEATLLYNLGMKARAVIEGAQIVVTQAWAAAQMLLRGNIIGATQALRVMAATMMTTPWGLILGFTAAIVTAYIAFSDSTDKAARQQKMFNDISLEVANSVRQEKDQLELRAKAAADVTKSDAERQKILQELIDMSPEHLKGLTLQNIATDEGRKKLDSYILSLEKSARAKAVAAKLTELYTQMLDVEKSSIEDNVKWYDHLWSAIKSGGNVHIMAMENAKTGVKKRAEAIAEIEENIQLLLKEQAAGYKPGAKVETKTTNTVADIYIPDADAEKKAKEASKKAAEERRKEREKLIEDAKKYQEEANSLERKAIDERIALLDEGFEKEAAIEAENHRRKLEDLRKQIVSESDIYAAEQKIDDPATSKIEKAYWMQLRQAYLDKNKHINSLIEIEESRHELKMGAIAERAEHNRLEKLSEQFEKEKLSRETAHNEQLLALGNNEKAKEELQRKFDEAELQRQIEHLEEILKARQEVLADKSSAMDLDLLTPEQRSDIERQVEELKNKISEIKLAKQDLQNKGGTDDVAAAFGQAFGDADVLGYSAEQWGQTFSSLDTLSEKLMAVKMVIGGLQQMWGAYSEYVTANENAQVKSFERSSDYKKRRLKWQLDNGYINQVQYNRQVEQLDGELDRKKAEVEYRQAKRQKQMAVINVLMNTAQAIMGIWAQVPKFDFGISAGALTAAVSVLGALQLGTILSTPLPAKGYEEGLYQDVVREQDGKVFRSRYGGKTKSGVVNRPTHFLTGENGPEMIIDAQAYRTMPQEVKDSLLRHIRGIKGFEQGYYNNEAKGGPRLEIPAVNTPNGTVGKEDLFIEALNRNSAIMEKIERQGIPAFWNRDYRNLKDFEKDREKMLQSRTKAQQ